MRKLSQEEFILKSSLKHNYFYTYDNLIYINSRTKATITCPVHGDFEQLSLSHSKGQGCPICYSLKVSKRHMFPK